jgi:hypothetical protein
MRQFVKAFPGICPPSTRPKSRISARSISLRRYALSDLQYQETLAGCAICLKSGSAKVIPQFNDLPQGLFTRFSKAFKYRSYIYGVPRTEGFFHKASTSRLGAKGGGSRSS